MFTLLRSAVSLVACQTEVMPLNVKLTVMPITGPAPLTVSFSAVPAGGRPPYESLVLNLGDGNIIAILAGKVSTYTYLMPRKNIAKVTVVDSKGSNAEDSVIINATAKRFVPGEVIVGYAEGEAVKEVEDLIAKLGGQIRKTKRDDLSWLELTKATRKPSST